ncbi:MAG: ATP-binding protein [Synechococcales cyanobacterium]
MNRDPEEQHEMTLREVQPTPLIRRWQDLRPFVTVQWQRQWQHWTCPSWLAVLRETRTQILLGHISLMGLLLGISVPTITHLLYQDVDQRVQQDMQDELEAFQQQIERDPPSHGLAVQSLLEDFLRQQLVEDDIYLIAIVNGAFHRSSPRALPPVMQPGSPLMQRWQGIDPPRQGKVSIPDPAVGSILFVTAPVVVGEETLGALVVAHTTAGERQEAQRALRIVLWVVIAVVMGATLVSWLISSWMLRPLRQLTTTAKDISQSNLSQRIPIQGQGELAELGATFNAMLDRLQAAFIQQQNFINDASHELRTPITIIQGHLDLLGHVTPDQQETLELVQDELTRMNRFVQDLLILAQAEQPNFWRPEWVDLASFTEELFGKAKVLPVCHLKLVKKGQGTVLIDRQRITQALLNLVENASQHTPPSGTIHVGSDVSREHVCFWVQDTGRGIAQEEQQRIFERFARVRNHPRSSQGAGLGLSIVQAIMKAAKGRVELHSVLGQGSTFLLIIPVAPSGIPL